MCPGVLLSLVKIECLIVSPQVTKGTELLITNIVLSRHNGPHSIYKINLQNVLKESLVA